MFVELKKKFKLEMMGVGTSQLEPFHNVPDAHVPTTDTLANEPPVLSSRVKTIGVMPIHGAD